MKRELPPALIQKQEQMRETGITAGINSKTGTDETANHWKSHSRYGGFKGRRLPDKYKKLDGVFWTKPICVCQTSRTKSDSRPARSERTKNNTQKASGQKKSARGNISIYIKN